MLSKIKHIQRDTHTHTHTNTSLLGFGVLEGVRV
jgi:hypothetical protein